MSRVPSQIIPMLALLLSGSVFGMVGEGAAGSSPEQPGSEHPNVVVILADDLGYGDLGCTGSREVPSPQLDALAKQGCFCGRAYASRSYLAPHWPLESESLQQNHEVVPHHANGSVARERMHDEGGVRVPLTVRPSSGRKAAPLCSAIVSLMDILPTLLEMNGVPVLASQLRCTNAVMASAATVFPMSPSRWQGTAESLLSTCSPRLCPEILFPPFDPRSFGSAHLIFRNPCPHTNNTNLHNNT